MVGRFEYCELANGLRVVCEVMPQVRSAAVGFLVRSGSRHEPPGMHGVSHFLEHMCFKGTATRDWHALNVRFDELGSIYNAYTSKEHTFFYGWVPAERAVEQLELLAEMMRPALPPKEFEIERGVILEEIAMHDDSFERHVSEFVHRSVFDGHPLAHEILGDRASIEALTHEGLTGYHRRSYAPGNMVLIAAGSIQPGQIFAAAERCCGSWAAASDGRAAVGPPPAPRPGRRKLVLPQFQQQAVVLVYPSVPQGHADEEALEAFTHVFGGPNSRCFWNVVQKGICTQAGATWLSYQDCGVMALYAYGEPERCERMLEALRAEAREVTLHGVSEAELERVRNQRRTQLALEGEAPRSRLAQIVEDLEAVGHVRTVEARLAATRAVRVEHVQDHLRRYPIDGEGLLLSVGPRDWPADA